MLRPSEFLIVSTLLCTTVGCNLSTGPGPGGVGGLIEVHGVDPDWGGVEGGSAVTIAGEGFALENIEELRVLFGKEAADEVRVLDDLTIQCLSPAGSVGLVAVTVQTNLGSDSITDSFRYEQPTLFAADGKAGQAGGLYRINTEDATAELIADLDYAITGLAMAPDGLLYATQSTRVGILGTSQLLSIDRLTGATGVIGPLIDAGDGVTEHPAIPDITFVEERLIGWTQNSDKPVEIDITTGMVTVIGGGLSAYGSGMATNAEGIVYLAPQGHDGLLFTVDPTTGEASSAVDMFGGVNSAIAALTFSDGVLYGVDNNNTGDADSANNLLSINVETGEVRDVGGLPGGVDSIAGNLP